MYGTTEKNIGSKPILNCFFVVIQLQILKRMVG